MKSSLLASILRSSGKQNENLYELVTVWRYSVSRGSIGAVIWGSIIVQQESWYGLWLDEGGPCVFYDRKY